MSIRLYIRWGHDVSEGEYLYLHIFKDILITIFMHITICCYKYYHQNTSIFRYVITLPWLKFLRFKHWAETYNGTDMHVYACAYMYMCGCVLCMFVNICVYSVSVIFHRMCASKYITWKVNVNSVSHCLNVWRSISDFLWIENKQVIQNQWRAGCCVYSLYLQHTLSCENRSPTMSMWVLGPSDTSFN